MGFPGGSAVKNLPAMQEMQVQPMGWEDPLEWQDPLGHGNPCPRLEAVFLPGESHGQRSLAGYSVWGCKRGRHNLGTKTTTKCSTLSSIECYNLLTWAIRFHMNT